MQKVLNLQRGSGEFIETSTANGQLLAYVDDLRQKDAPLPKWPSSSQGNSSGIGQGVDWNVQIFALEETLMAAARLGDSLAFREAAERLLLAEPRHPCAPQLEFISAFMAPSMSLADAVRLVSDERQRFDTLRFLVNLLQHDPSGMEQNADATNATDAVVARVEEAAKVVPFNKRTETEQALAVYYGNHSANALVEMAQKTKSSTIQTMVAIRLLQSGALEAVKTLASQLPTDVGQPLIAYGGHPGIR